MMKSNQEEHNFAIRIRYLRTLEAMHSMTDELSSLKMKNEAREQDFSRDNTTVEVNELETEQEIENNKSNNPNGESDHGSQAEATETPPLVDYFKRKYDDLEQEYEDLKQKLKLQTKKSSDKLLTIQEQYKSSLVTFENSKNIYNKQIKDLKKLLNDRDEELINWKKLYQSREGKDFQSQQKRIQEQEQFQEQLKIASESQTNLVKEVHRLQNINQQYRHQPNNQVLINAEKEKYSVLEQQHLALQKTHQEAAETTKHLNGKYKRIESKYQLLKKENESAQKKVEDYEILESKLSDKQERIAYLEYQLDSSKREIQKRYQEELPPSSNNFESYVALKSQNKYLTDKISHMEQKKKRKDKANQFI